MKKLHLAVCAALILGAAGAVIRHFQISALYADGSSLPVSTPLTAVMAVLSLLAVAAAIVFASLCLKSAKGEVDWMPALGSAPVALLSTVSGLVLAVCVYFITPTLKYSGVPANIFRVLGFAAALAMIALPSLYRARKSWGFLSIPALLPGLFACYWMAFHYRANAGDPIISDYALICLALGTTAAAFSYLAAFPCGQGSVPAAAASGLIALFFLIAVLPELPGLFYKAAFAALAVNIAATVAALPDESVEKSISNEIQSQ